MFTLLSSSANNTETILNSYVTVGGVLITCAATFIGYLVTLIININAIKSSKELNETNIKNAKELNEINIKNATETNEKNLKAANKLNKENLEAANKVNKDNIKNSIDSILLEFEKTINTKQAAIHLDKLSDIPYQLSTNGSAYIFCLTSGDITDKKLEPLTNEQRIIFEKIYAYGSATSINILCMLKNELNLIQSEIDTLFKNGLTDTYQNIEIYKLISLFAILTTQIKYDITNIKVSTLSWFSVFSSYDKNQLKAVQQHIKDIQTNLNLDDWLLISDTDIENKFNK